MIPVALAAEPADFDVRVRQKGLAAIAELVGEGANRRRRGPKRSKIASRREDIPPEAFPPHWRDVLPEMLAAYGRICAYLSLYIESATGNPSVDHVVPKSKSWDRIYEWSNYRLACALVNSKKGDFDLVLDPCTIGERLFELELVAFQVVVGPSAKGRMIQQVEHTIATLGLNARDCREARRAYVENYENGDISFRYLERRAPFIAQELRRQKRLRPEDV